MPKSPMNEFVQRLRSVASMGEGAGSSSAQLLEDYLGNRNEAALAALVRVHGPMVWGVCRRILPNYHDAEDAFQASFLVFVRRAASITRKELLANWLHGVALQTARKLRATTAKRCAKQRQTIQLPEAAIAEANPLLELLPLLDEELSRLPEKYKAVIVLCDLEGKTRKEVAGQLGVPEGTIASRIAAARGLLAKRLSRSGLTLSSGMLASLSTEKVSASVPAAVMSRTIEAATVVAAKQMLANAGTSFGIAALTLGVPKATFQFRIVQAGLLLLVFTFAGVALSGLVDGTEADEPPKATPEVKEKPLAYNASTTEAEQKPIAVAVAGAVFALAWSADGKTITTICIDYERTAGTNGGGTESRAVAQKTTIEVWNAKTGALKQSLGEEKNSEVGAIAALSQDGNTAAITAGIPIRRVRLLNVSDWQVRESLDAEGVGAIALSPDGKRLAIGGAIVKGTVPALNLPYLKLRDVEEKQWIREKEDGRLEGGAVTCLAFSPDGKALAAGTTDGNITLFNGEGKKIGRVAADHRGMILSIAFAPDSKTFASAGLNAAVSIWDAATGKLSLKVDAHTSAVAFTPDGQHLISSCGVIGDDKTSPKLSVWDVKTGKLRRTVPGPRICVGGFAFSPDGKTLAVRSAGLETGTGGRPKGELWLVPTASLLPESK